IIKQDGKYAAKLTGVSCVTGVKKIVVPTWSAVDQSDLVWYDAAKQSDGSYLAPFAMTNNKPGSYVSHVYVTDNRGCQAFAGSKNFTVELSAGDLSATSDQNKTEFTYTVKDLFVPVGYSNIRAAVWSDNKGQDDLTWYNVSVKGDTGSFTMPMSEHGDEGNYNIHLYAFKSNGTAMLVKKYTYDVDLTGCIRFVNRTLGSVDAIVRLPKDITAERVAYAVWCADNQSDMFWYTAEQQADGSYKAGISIANHQNHGGTYKVHAYYYDGKDAGHLINTTSIDLYGSFSADVNSCLITDGSSVEVKAGISGDGAKHTYGLFVLKPGKTKITFTATPVATAEGYGNVVIKAPLNLNGAGSLLTEKLVLAVKNGSSYTQISDGNYITNPEAVASNKRAFPTQRTKKGLQVKQEMLSDAAELGVKHAVINITLNDMVSKSGGIPYTYKGKTYYMDSGYIGRLDATTSSLASRGVITSAVLLMQYDSDCPELISPPARSAGHDLYEVNVTEEGPRNHLAALFSFLAERYSDSGHNVVNWIMGNEVSDYTHYNWGGNVSVDTFARNYTDAFRLLYNCAKSKYGNARIYISLDQFFNMARSYAYAGNEIFNRFVAQLQKEGDINWCMAYHPYPYPITDANFWAKRADVTNSADSKVFTLLNLKYLTDYIKNTYGSQHRFILSEQGFTSVSNGKTDEKLQAAAMAYGYYLAEFNDMVDSFVLHRHVDHLVEQQMGLYLGLWNNNSGSYEVATSKKLAWTVYKYMDTSSCQSYTNFALSVIGANSWGEIVPGYTAARFS
ncbi:MAG: DUF5722 domain-containing protein, partial [Lachnospiraceae bacterium]|nr:DUF5722 domain-containing protein [Lachnospiraceae bacterium]